MKVALGRAFIRDADLYLLDEPNAALDSISERIILKTFKKLVKGKIGIIVSHRIASIKDIVDKIVVFDHGTIEAIGTHNELLEISPTYREMFYIEAAEKVYEDIKSNSDLDDYVLVEFARQCGDFFDEFKSDLDLIAPYEAIDVLSLLTYSEAYWGSRSGWEQLIYRCLEKVRDGIYAGSLLSPAVFGGLSHIKLVISELSHRINGLNRFISSLNTILETRIRSYIDIKKPAFIHQAVMN